jgi:mediator of RNA polymerase II transcription subunit 5
MSGIWEAVRRFFKGLTQYQTGDKNRLGQAISAYIPICAQISIPLHNRLDTLQKAFNIFDGSGSRSLEDAMMDEVDANAIQFESNVIDNPIINSRAGLYIYLNALVGSSRSKLWSLIVANIFPLSWSGDPWSTIAC